MEPMIVMRRSLFWVTMLKLKIRGFVIGRSVPTVVFHATVSADGELVVHMRASSSLDDLATSQRQF